MANQSAVTLLAPVAITDAMFASSSVAEPDSGETAWNAATNYSTGTIATRATTHRKYKNAISGVDATLPENAPTRWLDAGPTNKWAMFDQYVNTATTSTGTQTHVINPGIATALDFYGLQGTTLTVVIKDGPGGTTISTTTVPLIRDVTDWYTFLFTTPKQKTSASVNGFRPVATPEITITLTPKDGFAKIGQLAIGTAITINPTLGGAQYGATAQPVDYSYFKGADDGTFTIVKRGSATNIKAKVFLAIADADTALKTVQALLSVPVSLRCTDANGYEGLSGYGLVSASLSYDGPSHAILDIDQRGIV
ncbi:MAG: hypothetical protein ACKVOO_10865 [Burkholderiaceae bacterium]